VPGDALLDLNWAPTWEGVSAANLHVARLILMLGCLAWLFGWLGRSGLVSALWGLLRPLAGSRFDTDRLVIRLSLVLENLKAPQKKGAWREMLNDRINSNGPEVLQISLPTWQATDTLFVAMAMSGLIGSVLL
jgi:hypothetical protein